MQCNETTQSDGPCVELVRDKLYAVASPKLVGKSLMLSPAQFGAVSVDRGPMAADPARTPNWRRWQRASATVRRCPRPGSSRQSDLLKRSGRLERGSVGSVAIRPRPTPASGICDCATTPPRRRAPVGPLRGTSQVLRQRLHGWRLGRTF